MILRNRTVASLLAAEVVSTTCSQMAAVALPWFVLVTTRSAARLSWVVAAEIAGMGVFGVLGGNIAGRAGARTTLLVCDAARVPLTAAIPLLHSLGALPFALLVALSFGLGAFSAPAFGARVALVPDVVGEEERAIGKAQTLFQASNRLTILAGPVLGGLLIGVTGATNVLWIDAASYLVAIALVAAFVPRAAPHDCAPARSDVLAGARFVWRDPLLRAWMLAGTLLEVCWQSLFVAIAYLAYRDFHHDAHLVGYAYGAFGGGALLGSALAFRLLDRVEPVLMASAGMAVQIAPLTLLPFDTPAWVVVAALAGLGFFNPFVNSAASGVSGARVPARLRQQAATFSLSLNGVFAPVGVLAAGPALAAFGARPVLAALVGVEAVGITWYASQGFRAWAAPAAA
ncbi:MAG TPA: MFS transporter [Gaiellaceae bacterium]